MHYEVDSVLKDLLEVGSSLFEPGAGNDVSRGQGLSIAALPCVRRLAEEVDANIDFPSLNWTFDYFSNGKTNHQSLYIHNI